MASETGKDHRADLEALAAKAGVTLDESALAGLAELRAEGEAGHAVLKQELASGAITPAGYLEACALARRDLVLRMAAVVPVETLVKVLGREARPLDPPPEREGWPYWLRRALPRPDEGRSYADVEFIRMLTFLCEVRAFDELDRGYRMVDPAEVREVGLLALLRAVFMWRDRIAEWAPLRERARAHLAAAGKPADQILMGLGRTEEPASPGPALH